ncbi:DUF2135 domain-containing protein [Myxococcota bacterium]|nr:DUF2135 domain-containing protein [Myxococcota bacterium]
MRMTLIKSFTGLALLIALISGGTAQAQIVRVKIDPRESPVTIENMTVKASVKGLHAQVDTEFVFFNPNRRAMEGELEFPLPDGASVNGYAIDVGGAMVDGVVVMKEKARVVFETEVRRGVDPGIIEHVRGNLYRTRIYPLPAGGSRRIRVSYTTPLAIAPDGSAALRMIMPQERIGKRSVTIEVVVPGQKAPTLGGLGDRRFELAQNVWRVSAEDSAPTPGEDVLVALPVLPDNFAITEKDRDGTVWFMATARTFPVAARAVAAREFDVYWDASSSREGSSLKLDLAFIEKLPADATYNLIVFRDRPQAPESFRSRTALLAALKEIDYDGGTNLGFMANRKTKPGVMPMLFTDGLDTLGDQVLVNLPTVIVSSAVSDMESLRQASGGAVIDLRTMNVEQAAGLFFSPAERVTGLTAPGTADVMGLGQAATGRAILIGRLNAPSSSLSIEFGSQKATTLNVSAASATTGGTLARAWAAMRVAQLAPRADDFTDELLSLGRKYGVVSPATTLIVLESIDQWIRHDIEPPETLPQMRNQWRAAMKGRRADADTSRRQHLETLEQNWKERLEWLRRDFMKNPFSDAGSKKEAGDPMVMRSEIGMRGTGTGGGGAGLGAAPAAAMGEDRNQARERRESMDEVAASGEAEDGPAESAKKAGGSDSQRGAAIEVQAWDPATPYMLAIKAAPAASRYEAYLQQKAQFGTSPSFFLDVADHFFRAAQPEIGTRVLTNLAEMKIEDAALLRVLAWRLRQEKQYELATTQFRRITKLRPEDPQSFRDLAVTLAEWGKATRDPKMLTEALQLFEKVAFTPWLRHADTISIFALEELNALISWIDAARFKAANRPAIPAIEEKFRAELSTDLRLYISWDADNTDIDLHVIEPSGEEAYYGHNRTVRGGMVSRDITDGYGPEEYLIAKAPGGRYTIAAKYYGSSQQTILGPATVTATIFTNWGRADEAQQTLSIRLDSPKDMVELGKVTFGSGSGIRASTGSPADLTVGLNAEQVDAILGAPVKVDGAQREYDGGGETVIKVLFDENGKLVMASRHFPGGAIMILVQ